MRNTALTLLTGLALAATAQAGEDYSAKAPVAPVPAPCLWEWFAGASGGYAFDAETDLWNVHVGAEYKCPGSDSSHALFLEVGYADWNKSGNNYIEDDSSSGSSSIYQKNKFEIVPVTLNYKYEAPLTQSLNWFIGGGAGVAFAKTSLDLRNDIRGKKEQKDTNFYGQLFVGLVYNVSEQWEITTSARYLYQNVKDYSLLGNTVKLDGRLNNDFYWDLGFRYNF
jgi:opacity protein-like surface antigen